MEVHFQREGFQLKASIRSSGFIGLTGVNGSGKTTLLHVISGFVSPHNGHISLNGREVSDLDPKDRSAVYVNSESHFRQLEVDKHLLWGVPSDQRDNSDNALSEIKEILAIDFSGRVGKLSIGQRSRVILGTAILSKPDVILIDEMFGSISGRKEVIQRVKEKCINSGIDVVFVSQDNSDLDLADHLYEMDNGVIIHRR